MSEPNRDRQIYDNCIKQMKKLIEDFHEYVSDVLETDIDELPYDKIFAIYWMRNNLVDEIFFNGEGKSEDIIKKCEELWLNPRTYENFEFKEVK